ncbi:MAG: hypothetical protein Q9167_001794 [Letrouitia subvulpina]
MRSRGAFRSSRDQDAPTSSPTAPTTEKITPIGPVPVLDLQLPSPFLMEPQEKDEVETPPSSLASEPHHMMESTNTAHEGAFMFSRKMWPSPHIQLKEMLRPIETTSIDRSNFLDDRNRDFKGIFWPASKTVRYSRPSIGDADHNRHHQFEARPKKGQSKPTKPETLSRKRSHNVLSTEILALELGNTVLQLGNKDLQTEAYEADAESMSSSLESAHMGSREDWVKARTDRNNRYLAIQALGQDSDVSTEDDLSFGVTLQQIPTKKYRTRSKRKVFEHRSRSVLHNQDINKQRKNQIVVPTNECLEDTLPMRRLQHESDVDFMSCWYGQEKSLIAATEDSKRQSPINHRLKDPFNTTLGATERATRASSSQQSRSVSAQNDSAIGNYAFHTSKEISLYSPPCPFIYLRSGPVSALVPACLDGMDLLNEFDTSEKVASILEASGVVTTGNEDLIVYGTCPSRNSSISSDEGQLLKGNMRRTTLESRSHTAEENSSKERSSIDYPDLFRSSDEAAETQPPRLVNVSMVEKPRELDRRSAARELCGFVYQCEKESQEESEEEDESLSECPIFEKSL